MATSPVYADGPNLTGWLAGLVIILGVVGVAAALWIMHHGA
jgi:hypothetical protein